MIIGISGLAGSGKDTAADFLVKNHGFTKTFFATPIKDFCEMVFHFSREQLWGPSSARNAEDLRYRSSEAWQTAWRMFDLLAVPWLNEIGLGEKSHQALKQWFHLLLFSSQAQGVPFTPRLALQTLGTEFGRAQDPDLWVKLAVRDDGTNKVLVDVRFKNEMAGIREAGGYLIRVKRGSGLGGVSAAHQSEAEQLEIPDSQFTAVIENQAISLGELELEVTRVYRSLC